MTMSTVDSAFWRGRRVFLTGHTGFKGTWLSLWLQHLGAEVVGYALEPPTQPSMFEIVHCADRMVSVVGDIRDLGHMRDEMSKHQPDVVLHLAAQALVRRSYADPVETYSTNVMGTVNLLEAVRACPSVKVVVNVTTDKCYENREWEWAYRESDPMGGHDPYSNSKGCAELVTAAYRNSFFTGSPDSPAVATARAGNVIGGGDWASDRLLPDIIRSISAAKPVLIRNPDAIRPWQHVLEPLGGYLVLAQHLWSDGAAFAGGWNFGPADNDAKPVRWIADRITRTWGDDASWTLDREDHPHEANYLKLEISKSVNRLGYRPRVGLATALDWVVEWYRAQLDGSDMATVTREQIDRFVGLPAAGDSA